MTEPGPRAHARKYVATPNAPITDKQADLVGREMDSMDREGVPVKPAALVARARGKSHPLHRLFEWNDGKAAQRYRVDQARTLMGSVRVVDMRTQKRLRARYSVCNYEQVPPRSEQRPREEVLIDGGKLGQVSNALYGRIVSACEDAEGLGLDGSDRAWRAIIQAVRMNRPASLAMDDSKAA